MNTFAEEHEPDQVVPFKIDFREAVPEHELCQFCGGETNQTLVVFEVPFVMNNQPAIARTEVPGHACPNCELETFVALAATKAYEAALVIVEQAQDQITVEQIESSIWALQSFTLS